MIVKPQWNLIGFFDDGVECETQISHYGKVLEEWIPSQFME